MIQTCFICPGCKFLGQKTILRFSKRFICDVCTEKSKETLEPKEGILRKAFAEHLKKGFKCPDCKRFIAQPLIGSDISCPYYDCCFLGTKDSLKYMKHPSESLEVSLEKLLEKKVTLPSTDSLPLRLLREAITEEINTVAFSSNNATVIHKISIGQAFLNLTNKMPTEMTSYLVDGKVNSSLQAKLFQEYIRVLENKLPFTYKKGKRVIRIDSLLSDELSLFDGISSYETTVTAKKEAKNETKEFYVGGRTGFHSKPYYIGKLLDVIDVKTKLSLMPDIQEYSFLRIRFKTITAGTKILVSHLRVPPHYQMGGMAHLNRMRKRIVTLISSRMQAETSAI